MSNCIEVTNFNVRGGGVFVVKQKASRIGMLLNLNYGNWKIIVSISDLVKSIFAAVYAGGSVVPIGRL